MSSNEQKPLTDLSLDVVLKFVDMQTSIRMAKSIKSYRPTHQKKWPLFKKVEFRCMGEFIGSDSRGRPRFSRYGDRISCDMDGQKFIQERGQSDEDYFRIIQEEVMRKEHRIMELAVYPNPEGWYHRMREFSELPLVKKFKFTGVFDSRKNPLFFKGLQVSEAFCEYGNILVLSLDPVKNARFLKVDWLVGNRRNMPFFQECRATHWNVSAMIDKEYDDFWVIEKFASGVMEVGSVYKANRDSSAEPMLQRMLQDYPQMMRTEEEVGKEKYTLDLANGTQLVIEKETNTDRQFYLKIV